MSNPILLQDRFTGIYRDRSPDDLPEGAVYDMQDWIPDVLGAPLGKRGGWSYHGSVLTDLNASAQVPNRVIVAPFSGGTQVLATAQVVGNERLFDVTNGVDRGQVYATSVVGARSRPVFYRELVIIPVTPSGGTVRKYTGSGAPAALGGTPPNGRMLAVYKDRLLLANDSTNDERIWFSGAGNPESWDTTNRWLDTSAPIVGVAPLRNAVLVFHEGSVERIRGDIPPGSAAANMTLEPLFSGVGLIDPDAFWVDGDTVYWADESGAYSSDGSAFTDLTKQGGIQTYWESQMPASPIVSLAVWRGYLFAQILNSSQDFVDFLVCRLRDRSWFRFSNIECLDFAVEHGTSDELYFSNRDDSSKRVGKLSSIFEPTGSVKSDANGTAVTPYVTTGVYRLKDRARKRWKNVYLSYDIRDAATDNPLLDVNFYENPEGAQVGSNPQFTETTKPTRRRGSIGAAASGIALSIEQAALVGSGPSQLTRLYAIEADVTRSEGSRRYG